MLAVWLVSSELQLVGSKANRCVVQASLKCLWLRHLRELILALNTWECLDHGSTKTVLSSKVKYCFSNQLKKNNNNLCKKVVRRCKLDCQGIKIIQLGVHQLRTRSHKGNKYSFFPLEGFQLIQTTLQFQCHREAVHNNPLEPSILKAMPVV